MKKNIVLVFLLALSLGALISLGVIYYFNNSKHAVRQAPKTSVIVAKAVEEMIYDKVEALGTTIANESVDITPNVTEKVESINFTDNQIVEQGEILVALQHQEELAQKQGEELQFLEHKRELKRLAVLVRKQAVTKRQYDERKTLVGISREKIAEINAKIADRIIKAPFAGVLGLKNISVGSLVSPGDIVTTIDDISKLKIDFAIPSIYLSSLKKGMPIIATSEAFQGKEFIGEVAFIDSRVDKLSRSIIVRAIIDNADLRLRPGLLLQIILLKNQRFAVLIPEEAILQTGNKHFVLKLAQDKKVIKQEIKIGVRKPGIIEVRDGLIAGDLVITHGAMSAVEGAIVSIKEVREFMPKKDNSNLYEEKDASF
jgi:membrane fusion protein (multidrug efflux system)